jgi:hypothetical protein
MSGIIWKSTTVLRNGDEVVTELAGGRSHDGRIAFVRRRRIPAASSASVGQAVSVKVSATGATGGVTVNRGTATSTD